MSEVPNVNVDVQSGGKPILNSGLRRTHVAIGWTSDGPYTAREVTYSDLLSTYVSGDLVKAVARAIDRVSANAIVVRRDHTPINATIKSTDVTNIDGTALASITGDPTEAYEIVFTVTGDGGIFAANATYSLSLDNGETEDSGTVPATGIVALGDSGLTLTFNPPANALVAITTEIRADLLAHFANAVAHNSADTTAAALITLGAPSNNAQAIAVLNQCRLALISHDDNNTVHDSVDLANVPTVAAAVTEQDGIALAINLKTKINLHLAATYPAATASLLALTASSVGVQVYQTLDLIPAGVAQLNGYPSHITFTTSGSGTPSDAPATVTIAGINADTDMNDSEVVNISQTAGTVTSANRYKGNALTITYAAGDGTGAQISIGTSAAAHNSADVTNTVTGANPDSGTLLMGDYVLASTTDPSPAIVGVKKSGGGTLTFAASGTPTETFRGRIEFRSAGTIGTEDDGLITYRLSLDDGSTWQPVTPLGIAEEIVVEDLLVDGTTVPTGVTISLDSSTTVTASTVITFRTTAPRVAIADVLLAMDAVAGSAYAQRGWRFFHIIGEYSASEMAQIQTKANALQASKQWNYVFVSFRDKRPYEDESDWITEVVADRATLNANRINPCAGYGRDFTCPVTNRLDRRPAAWMDVVRRLCVNENVESGRKIDGPIGSEARGKVGGETASGDVTLYKNGGRVEYDAEKDSRLADARITVLRTFTNQGLGVFVNGSRLGTNAQSNFTRTRDRELNDIASRALDSEGIRNLLRNVRRNPGSYPTDVPAQPGDPGTILESEAQNLETEMASTVQGAIGTLASSVRVTLSRTDNLTGKLGATAVPRRITYTCEIDGQPVIEGVDINQIFNG